MQILAVDIGTGTQDILLFDSERGPENCLKLVMPSPTLLIRERIQQATADAARTFNDDLDRVERELGVEIIAEETGRRLARGGDYAHIEFRDFDYGAISAAFAAFGVELRPDALALAVFDHGAAPPDVSDRQFRMDYLTDRLRADRRLSALAFRGDAVPEIMTRLRALADTATAQSGLPVIVMDTAPAAVLGALDDPLVAEHPHPVVVNIGNFHTLAFQFRDGQFVRLFEHHTGELTPERLSYWLRALAAGSIGHEAVFADKGHGALCLDSQALSLDFVALVGPRRAMLTDTVLPVYAAVPHGDQMLAGCYGLLRACADIEPDWRQPISDALAGKVDRSLW
jgi:uncharacterized protein (DUF1786 family)